MTAVAHPSSPDERHVTDIPKNSTSVTRVQLRTFERTRLCDARVYVRDDAGELKPTKKGLCIRLSQIAALIEALREAEHIARQMGWLDTTQRKAA